METAEVHTKCPSCNNDIEISQTWEPGGVNDFGGYVLQCDNCKDKFAFHLGRDIGASFVVRGAKKLDTYDDEVGNKVLRKHGLQG